MTHYILIAFFLYSLVGEKNDPKVIKQEYPSVTFEELIDAHLGDSVDSFLKGKCKWSFQETEPSMAHHYFPVRISNFIGELSYSLGTFFFETGNWSRRLKNEIGDVLDEYGQKIDVDLYVHFVDSLATRHRTINRDVSQISDERRILLKPPDPFSSYSVDYRKGQVYIIVGSLLKAGSRGKK